LAREDVAKLRAGHGLAAARRTQRGGLWPVAWPVDPRCRHAEAGRRGLTGACDRGSSAICRAAVPTIVLLNVDPFPDSRLEASRPAVSSNLEKPSATTEEPPMAIGSDIVAKAMKHEGVTDFFYIMGAPMLGVEKACMTLGLRGIDVRHEQAAAMAGFAYSRLLNRPSFCMAASGPGGTNLPTGIAHAWADCTPVIALGGAAPVATWHRGAFQDIDQLAIFKPCTKWSDRVHHVRRIPELIHLAVTQAMTGKPGPVYLDMPGDI